MRGKDTPLYTVGFAAGVCAVCAVLVSVSAVTLKERQDANKNRDMQRNVLVVAGLVAQDDEPTPAEIDRLYSGRVRAEVIALETGEPRPGIDPGSFDQRLASLDPKLSRAALPNAAKVARLPRAALVFKIVEDQAVSLIILPIEGKGLWSTLYGFLAIDGKDLNTIRGIAFYEHGETPGLGGEVDNPKWRGSWNGRKAFDARLTPVITVIKGKAGSAADDPHRVDGLSGATMTANGVTAMVRFWLSEEGYGPYLRRMAGQGGK